MCVLIVHWRQVPDYPVIVGAGRDEFYDRPSGSPRLDDDGYVFAPVDLRDGGTWLGVNAHGVFAAITNRSPEPFDATRRTRGELCTLALAEPSAERGRAAVERAVHDHPRNGFNLIVADAKHAFVVRGGQALATETLTPGTHVLTNRHELNTFDVGDVPAPSTLDGALTRLDSLVRDHTERDNYTICKHGNRGGTVSCAIIALGRDCDHPHVFRFADGAPCTTPFVDLSREVAALGTAPRGAG